MMPSMNCLWSALERVLLALWVGALCTVGFVVAPLLFSELERHTAGTLAGMLFHYLNYAGVLIGVVLIWRNQQGAAAVINAPAILLVLMLVSILGNEFGLAPQIAALREAGFAAASAEATRFGQLHAAASVLYLINVMFGLTLLVIGVHGLGRGQSSRC